MAFKRLTMIVAVGMALAIRPADPCCSVSPTDKSVVFGNQTNIIVWNPATHTEHFIRNAQFQSDAKDFGFIAPTPNKPELSEASALAFTTLAGLKPPPTLPTAGVAAGGAEPEVEVVQEADVAGYHATTLLARNAKALATWMNRNGYYTTPSIEAWTKVYVEKGWYLTAFKVANKAKVASTGTIRMSFKTARPFNPFYVPSDNIRPGAAGVLRVYLISDGYYDATIGQTDPWNTAMWHAPVPADVCGLLAGELKLPLSALPANAQVQAFEDDDFPRAAPDDVFFHPGIPPSGPPVDPFPWAGVVIVAVGVSIGGVVFGSRRAALRRVR